MTGCLDEGRKEVGKFREVFGDEAAIGLTWDAKRHYGVGGEFEVVMLAPFIVFA